MRRLIHTHKPAGLEISAHLRVSCYPCAASWRSFRGVQLGWKNHGMTSWKDVQDAEPEFAELVQRLFDAHRHKTIATLRADGSPRISGIEVVFAAGELTFGSMPNARKGADLRRDPRFALHSATVDPIEGHEADWPGEAKVAGTVVLTDASADSGDMFRAEITEVVHTHLDQAARVLVIDWWTPEEGLRRIERG